MHNAIPLYLAALMAVSIFVVWIGRADNDADRGQAVDRHSSHRFCHHPSWRHVNRSGIGRVEVAGVLHSRPNLRGDACGRPLVDPCHLRGINLNALQGFVGGVIDDGTSKCRCNHRRWIDGWI